MGVDIERKGKEVLSKEESVVEEKKNLFWDLQLRENDIFIKEYLFWNTKKETSFGIWRKEICRQKRRSICFTRGGLIKQHSWWTRCLWGHVWKGNASCRVTFPYERKKKSFLFSTEEIFSGHSRSMSVSGFCIISSHPRLRMSDDCILYASIWYKKKYHFSFWKRIFFDKGESRAGIGRIGIEKERIPCVKVVFHYQDLLRDKEVFALKVSLKRFGQDLLFLQRNLFYRVS